MADYNTKLNGEDVVLRDVTDPAYVAPITGYVIHLDTPAARRFVRAELDENRSKKSDAQDLKGEYVFRRTEAIAARDNNTAARDEQQAIIDETQLRIDEQRAFLQSQGDDPDA